MTQPAPRDGALSRHFMLHEFATHEGVLPPGRSVVYLEKLCIDVLEVMRAKFGRCTVISGYRSLAHNKAVGGAKDSNHLYDRNWRTPAADVRFERGTPEEWAAYAIRMKVGGVGTYPGHVHVDQRPRRARW